MLKYLAALWRPRIPAEVHARSSDAPADVDTSALADLLVHRLANRKFELDLDRYAQRVPQGVRGLAKTWTLFYLVWVVVVLIRRNAGAAAADTLLTEALERWVDALGGDETARNRATPVVRWCAELDRAVAGHNIEFEAAAIGHELPIAQAFLHRDESSPYAGEPASGNVASQLAEVLAAARDDAMPVVRRVLAEAA